MTNAQDGAPKEFVNKPTWGLPASLLKKDSGAHRIFTLMTPLGLNRVEKKRIVSTHKPKNLPREGAFSEVDAGVLAVWADPNQRFWGFWRALRSLREGPGKPRYNQLMMAPDLAVLMLYGKSGFSQKFEKEHLASIPHWDRLESGIRTKLKTSIPNPDTSVIGLWLQIEEELKTWDNLLPSDQERLSEAVFAISSACGGDYLMTHAIEICPSLEQYLVPLSFSELMPGTKSEKPVSPLPKSTSVKRKEERAGINADSAELVSNVAPEVDDDESESAQWESLLQRASTTLESLKSAPSIEGAAHLLSIATHLHERAPQIALGPRLENALSDLLEHAQMALERGPTPDGTAHFEVFNFNMLEALQTAWRKALAACSSKAAADSLQTDLERASAQSKAALTQCEQSFSEVVRRELLLKNATEALRKATGSNARLSLGAKKSQCAGELTVARSESFAAENELIQSLCPRREADALEDGADEALPESVVDLEPQANRSDGVELASAQTNGHTSAHNVEANSTSAEKVLRSGHKVDVEAHPDVFQRAATASSQPTEVPGLDLAQHTAAITSKASAHSTSGASDEEHRAKDEKARDVASTNEPDYSVHAGERCRPVWVALRREQPGMAFWMAHAIQKSENAVPVVPPSLLAALALSEHVMLPDGDVAQRLEGLFQEFEESWFDDRSDTPPAWTKAMNLLLFASVLRPILLCPKTGASGVAGFLHQNDPNLHRIRQECEEFAQRAQGFHVDAATFKTPREDAEWQRQMDAVREETRVWLERAPLMKMNFQAASNVWLHWTKPGGLISNLLAPVSQGLSDRLNDVSEAIASVSTTNELERAIHQTDRVTIGRRGEDIHSRALSQIAGRVGEALQLARRWVALEEQRPRKSSVLNQLIDDLRSKTAPLIGASLDSLAVQATEDSFALVAAAGQQVVRALKSFKELLDAEVALPNEEPTPSRVLGQVLVMTPQVDVDDEWSPSTALDQLEEVLSKAIAEPVDPDTAFHSRVAMNDLLSAQRILDIIEESGETFAGGGDLRQVLNDEIRVHREQLQRNLESAREQIDTGLALGLISEADRAVHEGAIVEVQARLDVDAIRDFRPVFGRLDAIFGDMRTRRAAKVEEATQRFEKLREDGMSEPVVNEIRAAITSGDMLTTNEYLQRLESGEPIHASSQSAQDLFNCFFPSVSAQIDQALEGAEVQDVLTAVEKGEAIASLDFSRQHPARLKEASGALEAWYLTRRHQKVERERLRALVAALGFSVAEIENRTVNGRTEHKVKTSPVEDRSICPIPHFGSKAKGTYRILCVWPRPVEDDVVKLVGDTSLSEPTILLYFGRLTNKKRQEASRQARAQQRSFILVDETMFLFLLSSTTSPATTLFSTALPFSFSQPYEPTSGVVPTEMFFGRLEELQTVQEQNGRCFIYGGRQLGKTALLRKAEKDFHAPGRGRHAKWIDLRAEGIGSNRKSAEIWPVLWRTFIKLKLLPAEVPEPNAVKGRVDRFQETMKLMLEANPDTRILLLLDEADSFFEDDGKHDFMETRRLKELMTASQWRFKVVFAGLHNVLRTTEQANHPLAHLGQPIKVGPLLAAQEWRDAEDLIRGPFEAAGFHFTNRSLITRILAQTNYYPSLIQLYCHHLLRHMLEVVRMEFQMPGPRYEIRASDVDAVYRKPSLREEIRAKFQLTLQLDTRYEVIAYTLAYEALAGKTSVAEGMPVWSISHKAREWWHVGFDDTSDVAFRVLLEEMVGLGVLRRSDVGNYSLRNPNVLLLLGSSEDVSDVLIRDREMPVEFEHDTFRARLANDVGPLRHPLTFRQRRSYSQQHSGVSVIFGSRALGVDRIVDFLTDDKDCEQLHIATQCNSRKEFQLTFERVSGGRQTGRTLLVVPPDCQWDTEMVLFAQKSTAKLVSEEKTLHVLFIADPHKSWQLVKSGELFEHLDRTELRQWRDGFVRQWLTDLELSSKLEDRKLIEQRIGYWPMLLQELGSAKGATLKTRLEAIKEPKSSAAIHAVAQAFGLDIEEPMALLKEMVALDAPETAEDLSILTSMDGELVHQSLAWAKLLGLVKCDADGLCELDAFVARQIERQVAAPK